MDFLSLFVILTLNHIRGDVMGISLKFLVFIQLLFLGLNSFAASENLNCIGMRCTYRLINPAVFSADQMRKTATQAITGEEHQRLNPQEMWIGSGSGPFENLEVAFSSQDPKKLELLKKIVVELDEKYNSIPLTPIRVTAQIYAVDEDALKDIGIGIDGFFNARGFDQDLLVNRFLPSTGALTGIAGSLPDMLRIQFNFAVEKGKAMRIEDRSQLSYHGSRFEFSDTQPYYRDGPVNTAEGKIGFELSGKIFVDIDDKESVNISDLKLEIGFAPTESQNKVKVEGNRSPFGVRKIALPSEYDELNSGVPKIIYGTIVYAHFDDDSFGLFTGVKKGGEASRLIVVLTAEVDPKPRPVPEFATETPEELRNRLDRKKGEGWHSKKKKKNNNHWDDDNGYDFFNGHN